MSKSNEEINEEAIQALSNDWKAIMGDMERAFDKTLQKNAKQLLHKSIEYRHALEEIRSIQGVHPEIIQIVDRVLGE